MILLRSEALRKWLKITRKNQEWLAQAYCVRPSYISQILNNRCPISGNFIGFILSVTRMNFEDLFYYDGEPDRRLFFGKDIIYHGKVINSELYYRVIRARIEKNLELERNLLTSSTD